MRIRQLLTPQETNLDISKLDTNSSTIYFILKRGICLVNACLLKMFIFFFLLTHMNELYGAFISLIKYTLLEYNTDFDIETLCKNITPSYILRYLIRYKIMASLYTIYRSQTAVSNKICQKETFARTLCKLLWFLIKCVVIVWSNKPLICHNRLHFIRKYNYSMHLILNDTV